MVFFYTPDKMMTTSSIVEFVSIGNDGGDTMTRVVYFAFVTRLAALKKRLPLLKELYIES